MPRPVSFESSVHSRSQPLPLSIAHSQTGTLLFAFSGFQVFEKPDVPDCYLLSPTQVLILCLLHRYQYYAGLVAVGGLFSLASLWRILGIAGPLVLWGLPNLNPINWLFWKQSIWIFHINIDAMYLNMLTNWILHYIVRVMPCDSGAFIPGMQGWFHTEDRFVQYTTWISYNNLSRCWKTWNIQNPFVIHALCVPETEINNSLNLERTCTKNLQLTLHLTINMFPLTSGCLLFTNSIQTCNRSLKNVVPNGRRKARMSRKKKQNYCSLQKACYSVGSGSCLADIQSLTPSWLLSSALHCTPQHHSKPVGKLSKHGVPAKQTQLQHKSLSKIAAIQLFL